MSSCVKSSSSTSIGCNGSPSALREAMRKHGTHGAVSARVRGIVVASFSARR